MGDTRGDSAPWPGYLVTIGVAVPNIVNRRWPGMENSTRWARSVPVEQVREFVEALPGEPIMPTGQDIIDQHLVTHEDGEHMDVIVPVHLQGTGEIWALSLLLDAGPIEPDGEPVWLWGLWTQRLMSSEELQALAIPS